MVDFTLFVLPGAYASGVSLTLDMLHAAEVLAPRLSLPTPIWRVVSLQGGTVLLSGGLHCTTTARQQRPLKDRSTWIFAGLAIDSASQLRHRLETEEVRSVARNISRHLEYGGTVAASCSSVFLLHAAGALQGRHATTTWWLAHEL